MKKQKQPAAAPLWRKVETCDGQVAIAYTDMGLYALDLPGCETETLVAVGSADPAWVQELACQLQEYFCGEQVKFSCPLDDSGYPPFYQKVLRHTAAIPYGETRSYQWLAAMAGSPHAVRAAGGAMANNRIPLVVPCHRVLRSDGSLGGFGYGLPWKEKLLTLEKAAWEDKSCK